MLAVERSNASTAATLGKECDATTIKDIETENRRTSAAAVAAVEDVTIDRPNNYRERIK